MSSNLTSISIKKWQELSNQEIQSIYELRSAVFVVEQKCVYLDPDHTDIEALHITAKENHRVTGYARLYEDQNWHIGRVIIAEHARGSGLGKELMNYAIKAIDKMNLNKKDLTLSAQVYLSDFYQALGFSIDGSIYLEDGIPHLKMVFNER